MNYWLELKENLSDSDLKLFEKLRNLKYEIDFKFKRGSVKYYLINYDEIEIIFKYFCETNNDFRYAHINDNIDIIDLNISDINSFIRDYKIKNILDK
jgi:hypothetical protein